MVWMSAERRGVNSSLQYVRALAAEESSAGEGGVEAVAVGGGKMAGSASATDRVAAVLPRSAASTRRPSAEAMHRTRASGPPRRCVSDSTHAQAEMPGQCAAPPRSTNAIRPRNCTAKRVLLMSPLTIGMGTFRMVCADDRADSRGRRAPAPSSIFMHSW